MNEFTAIRPIPTEYIPIISSRVLETTLIELNAGMEDILKAGQAKEAVYANKRELVKQKVQLDTEIKLVESDAIMEIRGEARSQYVMVGNEKVILGNDTARDAYRRMAAKDLRREMARIDGEIAAIDIDLAKASDCWYCSKDANDNIRAKANVQASLLNFLSNK
jgi:hypothetical protein